MTEIVIEKDSAGPPHGDGEECDRAVYGEHTGEHGGHHEEGCADWEDLPELKLSFRNEVACIASDGAITYEATRLEAKSSNCPLLSYDAMEVLRKQRPDLPFEILVQREQLLKQRQQTK